MPVYDARCTGCSTISEVRIGIDEEFPSVCSICGGRIVKKYSIGGISFKGRGFYSTDKTHRVTTKADFKPSSSPA